MQIDAARYFLCALFSLLSSILCARQCFSTELDRLLAAYPDFISAIDGNLLVWKDGTRMVIDDRLGLKTSEMRLDHPDIKDMFSMVYPEGKTGIPPKKDFDPGRVRYAPFFQKIYGDCNSGQVAPNLVDVVWLPKKYGKTIRFNKINGAAEALQNVSMELDQLDSKFDKYLIPTQGTYNCRKIAKSENISPHSFGIAIDISTSASDYWQWQKVNENKEILYKNKMPWEIINIFEKHGFIWGGKWYHFDTMHFEFRPEIIKTAK